MLELSFRGSGNLNQTILIENESGERVHYGFWRDDAKNNPVGIVRMKGTAKVMNKKCKMIHPIASNLFYFVREMIANGSNKKEFFYSKVVD